MTNSTRRRVAGFGVAAILAMGGGQWAMAHADAAKPEPAAAVRRVPWWPPQTSSTLRRSTTTAPAPTTTVAPSTTASTAPPTTEAPATTAAPTTTKAPTVRRTTATTAPAPAPAPAPSPAPAPAPAPRPAVSGTLSSSTLQSMLAQVNAVRASGTSCGGVAYGPVPALQLQGTLTRVADAHAADMAANGYFNHNSLDGTDPGTRMTRAGYSWSAWAENIAAGQSSASSVVSSWFASAGHCHNFMSPNVTQVGFGYAENAGSTYKKYWVADLGTPR